MPCLPVSPWPRRSSVATLANWPISDGERSEAGQADLFATRQCCRDRGQRRVDGLADGGVGLICGSGNGGDQVGLVHGGARRGD